MSSDPIGHKTLEIMNQARSYNARLFDLIRPHLSGRVAEVGAGIGNFTGKMISAGLSVTAIDINHQYLAILKKSYPSVDIFKFDLGQKSLPPNLVSHFDSAVILNVLEHIADHNQALTSLHSLLRPGGKLIILVPAHNWAFGSLDIALGHVRRYDRSRLLTQLAESKFKAIFCRYFNFFGVFGWWFNSAVLHRKIIPSWQVKLFDFFSPLLLFWEKYIPPPIGLSLICIAQKD